MSITSTGGAILDAGDTYVNVVADAGGLRLSALNSIGALGGSANVIETTVLSVSARAGFCAARGLDAGTAVPGPW